MTRPRGSDFGFMGGSSGSAGSYLTDSCIGAIQRIAACVVLPDEHPSRCARPGEKPRNREQRCEHGFVDNGENCIDCSAVAMRTKPIQSRNKRAKSRALLLRLIASGHTSQEELMRGLECSAYQLSTRIVWLRRLGLVTHDREIRLTQLGLEQAGWAGERAGDVVGTRNVGMDGEVSR